MLFRRINLQSTVKWLFPKDQVLPTNAILRSISSGQDNKLLCERQWKNLPSSSVKSLQTRTNMTITSTPLGHEKSDLMAIFPDVVRELTEFTRDYDLDDVVGKWFAEALKYNLPGGSCFRPTICLMAYNQLIDKTQIALDNYRSAYYLAWSIELFHCLALMFDDVMDSSVHRRDQLCWHRQENVGMMCLNDALMIENGLYFILEKYFGQSDNYIQLVDLFRESMMVTIAGQCMDLRATKIPVTDFNMGVFTAHAGYKTAYYSFYFPIAVPMILFGISDPKVHDQAKTILREIGTFYQMKNDFVECFGDQISKTANDIQENKCTWLAAKCMEMASDEQKTIMKECYGQTDSEKVARVKQLYEELEIPRAFLDFQKDSYNMVMNQIDKFPIAALRPVLVKISNKVYDCYNEKN